MDKLKKILEVCKDTDWMFDDEGVYNREGGGKITMLYFVKNVYNGYDGFDEIRTEFYFVDGEWIKWKNDTWRKIAGHKN